ncbi:MAG: 50S ribosomal protein L5 [Acidobacteria bacterium]|nr:MAG: 50S ribosomal protein L5 [Acidobacteriota bacterium]
MSDKDKDKQEQKGKGGDKPQGGDKRDPAGAEKAAQRAEAKARKKGEGDADKAEKPKAAKPSGPKVPARIKERYVKEVVPTLMKERNYPNVMAVPRLRKIVVNMGVGEATQNIKVLDAAMEELGRITGQRPAMRRSRKSIAAFRLRQGMPIAATVTLRGDRMYEFVDRLFNVALPRVRDFRGVPTNSFDGRGNYTLGLKDQLIFPEVDYAKVEKMRGMNVTFVTSARTDEESKLLLQHLGMPFRSQQEGR